MPGFKFKKIIIGNWKMYLNLKESIELIKKLKDSLKINEDQEVVVCPSFTALNNVQPFVLKMKLGAQDVFWEKKGAYTGEISAPMLEELDCQYVIIGHSEKRKYYKETDEMVNKKLQAVLKSRIIPVVCIGETLEQREKGLADQVVLEQLEKIFKDVTIVGAQKIIIAYEPVWAIGTGRACQPEEAVRIHYLIRHGLYENFTLDIVEKKFRIIYGGSVSSKNVASYTNHKEIQGVLVGGASAKASEFFKIIEVVN